jgi:hypothetical protein
MTGGAGVLDGIGGKGQLPSAFHGFYLMRPHVSDPYSGVYRLSLRRLESLEHITLGVYFWRSGVIRQCSDDVQDRTADQSLDALYRNRPTAVASQFLPISGVDEFERTSLNGTVFEGKFGKEPIWQDLGWLRLGDLTGSNSVFLFEDGCGVYNNVSAEAFIDEVANTYRADFARTAFVESALDGSSWDGILYLAYYPNYNRTWVVIYNIPEDTISTSKVKVDGVESETTMRYPFIIVKGYIPEGSHRLTLSTQEKEYELDFKVSDSPLNIEPLRLNMSDDGRLHATLTHQENEIILHSATAILDGDSKTQTYDNMTVSPYESADVDIDFRKDIDYRSKHTLELRVNYNIDGKDRWLNRTLM